MLGTKPSSAKCAGQLMCLSGGLAIAAGLFAWATTPATVYWLAVELTVGVLWLGASTAIRTTWQRSWPAPESPARMSGRARRRSCC
jgi:hypothetical protein